MRGAILLPVLLAGAAAAAVPLVRQDRAATTPTPTPSAAVPTRATTGAATAAPVIVPTVVARYPHDPDAFTEGLVWHRGALYESVGLEGQSDVRRVDLPTGKVLARATIPASQFGEGLAVWKDELVSLTWHDEVAHRWTAPALKPAGTLRYKGEGWGLTSDGGSLIRSDGSATLHFHDPATLAVRGGVVVTLNDRRISQINELEWVDGAILANVWHTPYLLRIDPATGRVGAVIDLSAIVAEVGTRDSEAVANGIAWDPGRRRLFVTGKRWPTLFEIALPAG